MDFAKNNPNEEVIKTRFSMKVLMVEDDYINIFMMQKIFESLFEISYAKTGQEALLLLNNNLYDLVLMDINLGDDNLTGVDVFKHLRADKKHVNTKVFAVTGYVLNGDRVRYLDMGFDEHFPKPLTKDTLLNAIARFFI